MSEFTSVTEGLVTKQSPIALPPTATDCLVNFDVNELGQLSKRYGTVHRNLSVRRIHYKKRIRDVELLITISGTSIIVLTQALDTLYTIGSVYDQSDVGDFTVADVDTTEYFSVVVFASNCNPIQVFFHEIEFEILANDTAITLDIPLWSATRIKAFEGSNNIGFSYTVIGDTYWLIFAPVGYDRRITLIHYGYGAWFPAQYYFGEELFRALSRGTSTIEQVPLTLLTGLDTDNQAHIKLYRTNVNTFGITQRPKNYDEVAFSDGQSYEYDVAEAVTYSPYFMTFGQPIYERKFDLSIENINTASNTVQYTAHGLRNNMYVQFYNEVPGGVATGLQYEVVNTTADSFQLNTVNFLSTYSTARAGLDLYAHKINTDGTVTVSATANTTPTPYRLYSNVLLPPGLVSGEKYYLTSTGSTVRLYYDQSGKYPINLSFFKSLRFDNTDVDIALNTITIAGHSWSNGVPVAIVNSTNLPGGLVAGTVYYIGIVDSNTIKLYTTAALTTLVNLTSTGSGTFTLTEAWGPWHLEPEYINGYMEVVNAKSVLMLRARKLALGKVASSVVVRVDGTTWTRSTSASGTRAANRYYVSDEDFNIITGAYDEDDYINFGATPELGLSRTSFVQLINTRKFLNMHSTFAAGSTYNDTYALNTVITVYGYADRFSEVRQPQAAALVQNRLVLSIANTLVCSNTADSFIKRQFYNNFIVDDRLTGEFTQQFEIVLSDVSSVVTMLEYQNSLLVFTRTSIYRVINLTYNNFSVVQIARHGIPNAKCVTRLHSALIYYNKSGVYTLSIDVQETYYATELSVAISDELKKHTPKLIQFDSANDLLYVISERMYVLNTRSNKWTEYKFAWQHNIVDSFVLDNEVSLVDKAVATAFTFRDVKYDLMRTATNSGGQSLAYSGGNLSRSGATLLNSILLYDTLNTIPFAEDYHLNSTTIVPIDSFKHNYKTYEVSASYTYRRKSVVFEVDSLPFNTLPGNTSWSTVVYGYPVDAVFLSSAIKAEQLSLNNRVIYVEVVLAITEAEDDATIGVLYGNDSQPEVLYDAISKVGYPPNAVFTVLKESLQGTASSYRLLLVSKNQCNTVFSGMSFLEAGGGPMYHSGGN